VIASGQGAKKTTTVEREKTILGRWIDSIDQLRLDQIRRVHINRFIEKRLKHNVSPRTINLDVIPLRVLLKRAISTARMKPIVVAKASGGKIKGE